MGKKLLKRSLTHKGWGSLSSYNECETNLSLSVTPSCVHQVQQKGVR